MFKPKHFSTIILKKPGMIVPKDILQLTVKENPSCCGYAIQAPNETGKPSLFTERYDRIPGIDKIELLQEEAKEYWMTLFFSKFDGKFDKELVQPFTLFGGPEDEAHIALFVEGDFPQFSDASEVNSDEFKLANNFLFPKLQQINRLTKHDMDALREEMETELFANELLREIGHRGMFVMMLQDGEPICFGKNSLGGEFEWGATSNLHHYEEEKEQAPIEKKETVVQRVRKRFGISMDDTPAPSPAPWEPTEDKPKENPPGVHTVSPPTDKPVIVNQVKKEETNTAQKTGGHYWEPPRGLTGRHLKKAIRKMAGLKGSDNLPEGWDKIGFKLWVPDNVAGPIKDLKEVGKVLDMKQAEPRPVSVAPSITDTERKAAEAFILKHLDSNSNVISSIEDMAKAEEKWPSFSEKVTPLEKTFRWPADKTWAFFQNNTKAAFIMWLEYRRSLFGHLKDKLASEEKTSEKVEEKEIKQPVVEQKRRRFGIGGGAFSGKSAA